MIASFPMYDRPETAAAHNRLWAAVRSNLSVRSVAAPRLLDRTKDLWDHWEAPDLFLSQTCGLPYRARLHGKVQIVGVPNYQLEGCPPGYYASKIVVRQDDTAVAPSDWQNKRMAFNELRSQSGWAAMLNHAVKLGASFLSAQETGSHYAAAKSVAQGRADIACIDAQTWRMIWAFDPWAKGLKVIDQTDPTPGLPLITAGSTLPTAVAAIRDSFEEAVTELTNADRSLLCLYGVVDIPADAYLAVPTPGP